ncbi:MAG: transcriptional regulator [Clostridia bacterium]|jgi:ArsR family transcriptional regulator|uniref:Helix-turn-helix transcriptional regulator n=1 Tax=Proteiniclasticum aestuarii TaxID=2817862 RepID=A0A939KKH2_9CLOT|nr:metalloregulator ArsR/SmtB family transcription factor [Proteiniclasticum aestuarii]MBO1266218.1 helix-turn-helix transcriptional regulator [Proteiniclasticum aestuarii]NCC79882.1 transcriptional regulator [Clostridia bacterium]
MEKDIKKFDEVAEILKAMGHPARLCILNGIIQTGGCNVSHMQDCLELPQSTISQHLQKLRSAGIIEGTRNGTEITYTLKNQKVLEIITTLYPQEEK